MLEHQKWHFRASRFKNFLREMGGGGGHVPRPPFDKGPSALKTVSQKILSRFKALLFIFFCVTTESWLCFAVCKECRNQEIRIFTFKKIYLHSRHYFTSGNCIFMQLQGIVFIRFQGNDILVNCKEINSFKGHIFIHTKYNLSRQLYSFTESYSFQGTYQFILGNISSFKENIFIQGHYIHSILI